MLAAALLLDPVVDCAIVVEAIRVAARVESHPVAWLQKMLPPNAASRSVLARGA